MKSERLFVVDTKTLSSYSSATPNDGVRIHPVGPTGAVSGACAHAAGTTATATATASIASTRAILCSFEPRIYHMSSTTPPGLRRLRSGSASGSLSVQPFPTHVDPAREREPTPHERPKRGIRLAQEVRIDEPPHGGLAAEPRAALEQRRHALGRVAPRRDLELLVESAEDALDALARGPDQPAEAVIGHAEAQVDQDGELEVAQVPRRRVLELLAEHVGERELVDEHLLDGVLRQALGHRPLVEEATDGRARPALALHELLDLVQIAGVARVHRPEQDARRRSFRPAARLEDALRDDHARLLLGTEVEVENQVLHLHLEHHPNRVLRRRGAQEVRRRPALPDPGAHLGDRVGRIVGDEEAERLVRLAVALAHRPVPPVSGPCRPG